VIGASKVTASDAPCDEFYAGNPPLVPASARNQAPFTSVHSHADAQKSSGTFFRDMDRGKVPETSLRPQKRAEGLYGGAAK